MSAQAPCTSDSSRENRSEVSPELIAKVTQDDYFKYLVDREVQARTQEKLSSWWKRLALIAGIVMSILTPFGIKQYLSFTNVVGGIKEAHKDVDKAQKALEMNLST